MKSIIFLLLLFPSIAIASPFLVCDVDENATHYILSFNGGEPIEVIAPLKYDVSQLPVGSHTVEVKAKNELWGIVSDASPFSFIKPRLVAPVIQLVK